jgi:hypothetical protein
MTGATMKPRSTSTRRLGFETEICNVGRPGFHWPSRMCRILPFVSQCPHG